MPGLKDHVNVKTSPQHMFLGRFSRHPERYIEIFRIFRKYELHHVAAEFGMGHWHEDEDDDHAGHNGHSNADGQTLMKLEDFDEHEDHAKGLTSALEELGPCFIKYAQGNGEACAGPAFVGPHLRLGAGYEAPFREYPSSHRYDPR